MNLPVFCRPKPCSVLAVLLSATALMPTFSMAQSETPTSATVLGKIVITAGGFEQTVRDAPASVSVVTAEELEKGQLHQPGGCAARGAGRGDDRRRG